ncbi:WhiB family transcriptional regulator [Streptomyces sp. NBC_01136]|uniref:WhiB family transcriptional regulator n=1 Tax=unclassified Streptomyces TaxID=2593676 RepID=UPI00324BD9CD|nr:WhiB family transcriptional regulator [Streptomyces sp. NBC_01136]
MTASHSTGPADSRKRHVAQNNHDSGSGAAVDWWHAAHCRGTDVETFFPLPDDQTTIEQALTMCGLCQVRIPCRRYALSQRERHGIWGGLSEATRESLMRRDSPHRVSAVDSDRLPRPHAT